MRAAAQTRPISLGSVSAGCSAVRDAKHPPGSSAQGMVSPRPEISTPRVRAAEAAIPPLSLCTASDEEEEECSDAAFTARHALKEAEVRSPAHPPAEGGINLPPGRTQFCCCSRQRMQVQVGGRRSMMLDVQSVLTSPASAGEESEQVSLRHGETHRQRRYRCLIPAHCVHTPLCAL
eukprot:SAG25_NODE_3298_length_1140_cov_1.061479_2_plen_176_part_01